MEAEDLLDEDIADEKPQSETNDVVSLVANYSME